MTDPNTIMPKPPRKPAFASLNVEVGDANANGVADVRIMLRIGTLDLPAFTLDMDEGRALVALLNVVSDWKLGLGRG
ncbi:MAG: hypothetical protein IT382_01845 [Deltaproteobacteria bacterium]|nr:hypothetical protein [Deltaproteobacteria bacterium]